MAKRDKAAAKPTASDSGILVQICVECGREYTFEDEPPPEDMKCEKCGGGVFRSYYETEEPSEASRDFTETTGRDMRPDDPEGETTSGDLVDLERL
jgi:hypothetical protein